MSGAPSTTSDSQTADSSRSSRPTLRVVTGSPSPEELAVVTALLAAAGGEPAADAEPASTSRWADPAGQLRRSLRSGPGAWVAAARRR